MMIKDLSWLKISDVFARNIRQISWNKVIIYEYILIRIWGADTVRVPVPVGESTHLVQNRKISEYLVGKSTNLLQNREISDIRIRYNISERCCKSTKYPKISSRISAEALLYSVHTWNLLDFAYWMLSILLYHCEKESIYQWILILARFYFWRLFWFIRATLMLKTVLTIIRGRLLPEKIRFENTNFSPYIFLNFSVIMT
jgi:hypothetical protein